MEEDWVIGDELALLGEGRLLSPIAYEGLPQKSYAQSLLARTYAATLNLVGWCPARYAYGRLRDR